MEDSPALLGIDIGPNSIGWALLDSEGKAIDDMGARVFEAGLADIEQDGKGKSRNVERRDARCIRRRLERTGRRLSKLARILQDAGLLPPGDVLSDEKRHQLVKRLDAQMDSPYSLRAKALDEKLKPYELGRALYHLAQRRGFLSNRKSAPKDEKEEGVVKEGIGQLRRDIDEAGARTLGEYFAKLDPHQQRIRGRYTSRKMYEDEFKMIWQEQRQYYPDLLTDDLKKAIHSAIFYQRPLKSAKHLIGGCQLENGKRRAPWALLIAQRYRYLSVLNNLTIRLPDGSERELTADERSKLIDYLEKNAELKFTTARGKKLLALPRGTKFNLEEGGEKRMLGNATAAKLRKIFGDRWDSFSEEEQDQIVEDIRSIVKDEALVKRGITKWGLDEESARKLTEVQLPDGYCRFSRKALQKLVPLLEQGKRLQTAIRELYPEKWARGSQPLDSLPPLSQCEDPALSELRNPIVSRALTEIRRVVNGVIAKHGKPDVIRVELARDVAQPAKRRQQAWKQNRQQERARKDAAERITKEAGIEKPSRDDILKVLLADECNWECPYTGRRINITELFGEHPQFDIEHIIPFDRCLDDSYVNKTLCEANENRNIKKGKTPYEAYYGTDKWENIISRVSRFNGRDRIKQAKLRRFKMHGEELEEFLDNFTNRQLNDTRYGSKLAKKYLGLLYGGVDNDGIDASRKRRVQATIGAVTAKLRDAMGLNAVLGKGAKSRDDHRHHAVDAVVIALTSPGTIKGISDASQHPALTDVRKIKLAEPWQGFLAEVRQAVDRIVVSHRVDRRVRGPLHEETFYGKPRKDESGKSYVHTRKPLSGISAKDVDSIVDPVIRRIVQQKLSELGESDPKKAFKDAANLPLDPQGRVVRRVRLKRNLEVFPIAKEEHRRRYVVLGNNHHMEIVGVGEPDEHGEHPKWEAHVVSMFEAYQRKKNKEPIVKRDWSDETEKDGKPRKFLFSLAGGDTIELQKEEGKRELFIVRTVPQMKQVRFVPINDARRLKDIGKVGFTAYPETLRKWHCRKVAVNPIGEVHYQND